MTIVVCAFPAPRTTSGEIIDLEVDSAARAILHRRINTLPRAVLIDCALKAGEDVRDIREFLHEAVDDLLGSYTWLATGGYDTEVERFFWMTVALAWL